MDDAPHAEQRDSLPVACTLGPDHGPARLLRWQRLHETASPVAQLCDGVLEVRYQPVPGVLEELSDLAAAEQICCSFVAWSVATIESQPVLQVAAPPEAPDAVDPIAAMFDVTGSGGASKS